MKTMVPKVNFLLLLYCFMLYFSHNRGHYLNKWAVHIEDGPDTADKLAEEHGFRNLGQIGTLENYFLFEHHGVSKRSADPSSHHSILQEHPKVKWIEQQIAKKRVKRDLKAKPKKNVEFNDPLWVKQWYLHGGASGGFDMNVSGAWAKGYTGKGVVITILDDGIEHNHTDLHQNYDPQASLDINGHDSDPMPRYDGTDENKHGTRCAGEVSAAANNSKCGVGVAYNSKIGGVRMLDGDVSDYVEASSLSLSPQHIDIYSASWGPDDNGKVVDGPAKLAKEAFIEGVLKGRNGKGSIFVWASGNGGSQEDSCACDGYTNSIFTLSISSASEHGMKPWYLEECASTLATTYSSGDNYHERKITTTDLHNRCTESHTGTSASAPLAAGIIALVLEANSELTWRDLQYIVLMTARPEPLRDGKWDTNGMNRKVSHKYGYGLMDATAMVELAEKWTPVPEQHICMSDIQHTDSHVGGQGTSMTIDINGCHGTENYVRHLEHVQAKVSIKYARRGDLEIHVVSPAGTKSKVLPKRRNDFQSGEFRDWPFMSVHFWGEQPFGTWKLIIENVGSQFNTGVISQWQLILYGTEKEPIRLRESQVGENGGGGISGAGGGPYSIAGSPFEDNYEDSLYEIDNDNPLNLKLQQGGFSNMYEQHWGIKGRQGEGEEKEAEIGDGGKWVTQWWSGPKDPEGQPCSPECDPSSSCSGPDPSDCDVCRNVRVGDEGPCVQQCPIDRFLDLETNVCRFCTDPCKSCKGSNDNDCLSCIEGYYFVEDAGLCLAECPNGYFQDPEGKTCTQCDLNCNTCSGAIDYCTSCEEGLHLIDGKCQAACELDMFRDDSGRCVPCHSLCKACKGPGKWNCLSCQDSLFYQNGTCVTRCSQEFFEHIDADGNRECKECHPSCKTCQGSTAEDCVLCKDKLKKINGKCIEDCQQGYYRDEHGSCQSCNDECFTCQGAENDACLSCKDDRYFHDGTCVEACPGGFFGYEGLDYHSTTVKECRACFHHCTTCTGPGPSDCKVCEPGLHQIFTGECVSQCQTGEFLQGSNCEKCHSTCKECMGGSDDQCTSCDGERSLLQNECLTTCPSGYFSFQQECYRCHFSCNTCKDTGPAHCMTCKPGFTKNSGICMQTDQTKPNQNLKCPKDKYLDLDSGACAPCDSTCLTCDGGSSNDCLTCSSPRTYYPQHKKCILCCSDEVKDNCCKCHPETGVCLESRTTEDILNPTRNENIPGLDSPSHNKLGPYKTFKDFTSTKTGFIGVVVLLCVIVILVGLILFGVLQAKAKQKLCWGHRYEPVPMFYQNGTDRVKMGSDQEEGERVRMLTEEDYEDEDDIYSA